MVDYSTSQRGKVTRRALLGACCLAGLDPALAQAPVAPPRPMPAPPVARKYPPRAYMFFDEVISPTLLYKVEANVSDALLNGVTSIVLVVSSAGGSIDAAVGIHNVFASIAPQVTSYNIDAVDSAANVVFQSASKRIVHPNAHFLFHPIADMATMRGLNAATTQDLSDALLESRRQVVEVLRARTKLDAGVLDEMFHRQVIIGAEKALAYGLVDEIAELKFPLGQVMIPTL